MAAPSFLGYVTYSSLALDTSECYFIGYNNDPIPLMQTSIDRGQLVTNATEHTIVPLLQPTENYNLTVAEVQSNVLLIEITQTEHIINERIVLNSDITEIPTTSSIQEQGIVLHGNVSEDIIGNETKREIYALIVLITFSLTQLHYCLVELLFILWCPPYIPLTKELRPKLKDRFDELSKKLSCHLKINQLECIQSMHPSSHYYRIYVDIDAGHKIDALCLFYKYYRSFLDDIEFVEQPSKSYSASQGGVDKLIQSGVFIVYIEDDQLYREIIDDKTKEKLRKELYNNHNYATLTGFFRDKQTLKYYAVTAMHLFFKETKKDKIRANTLIVTLDVTHDCNTYIEMFPLGNEVFGLYGGTWVSGEYMYLDFALIPLSETFVEQKIVNLCTPSIYAPGYPYRVLTKPMKTVHCELDSRTLHEYIQANDSDKCNSRIFISTGKGKKHDALLHFHKNYPNLVKYLIFQEKPSIPENMLTTTGNIYTHSDETLLKKEIFVFGAVKSTTIGTVEIAINNIRTAKGSFVAKGTSIYGENGPKKLPFVQLGDSGSLVGLFVDNPSQDQLALGMFIQLRSGKGFHNEDNSGPNPIKKNTFHDIAICVRLDHSLEAVRQHFNIDLKLCQQDEYNSLYKIFKL